MKNRSLATLAGGCFWCTEAVFQRLNRVTKVTPGYTGGNIPNPTYEAVTTGETGHAEAIQIEFDPEKTSFRELLRVFFATHDPTTLNRQGNDVGTQYRSEIFYHDQSQKVESEMFIKGLESSHFYPDPIVTKISKFKEFYPAEDYHLNYYNRNKNQPYCKIVIEPKLEKLNSLQISK